MKRRAPDRPEDAPPPAEGNPESLAAGWFRGQELADAAAALRTLEPDPRSPDRTRVWKACLKLSKGRLPDLYHYVRQAKLDVRDVLYWAEYYGK